MAYTVEDLYGFVLALVLIGLILGVGLITLSKFGATSAITADASEAINDTISALKDIATSWFSLIVTIVVLSIILGLVISSFGGAAGRR